MSVLTDSVNYVQSFTIPSVVGLSPADQDLLDRCVRVWAWKQPRNLLRSSYDDMHQHVQGLQGMVPDSMLEELEVTCGWPHLAVDKLNQRIIFDGLVASSGDEDPFSLRLLLRENRFETELPQATASALIHSVSFVSTTRGDVTAGEPDVVIMPHSALWSSAIWDRRRRQIRAAFTVNEVDDSARPILVTLFTPTEALTIRKGQRWYLEGAIPHGLDRVPVEPLAFDPSLERPFGRSRISREVMAITDRAMRTAFRGETAEALYAAMKIILLGAEESAFQRPDGSKIPVWDWAMQRINAISKDDEGDTPTVQVINGQSPEPYIASRRDLAAQFSGATSVPMSALGVMTDSGPSSADAIYAAKEDLVIQATHADRTFGAGLARVFQNAVMIRDGREMDEELASLSVKWRNPALPSIVSQSDAMVKQISAIPWIAETTVALEELGYTDEQITRLLSDKRRQQSQGVLSQLLAGGGTAEPNGGAVSDAADLKEKFDALGVAVRAGVDPDDAARRLGLGGVKFTGAVPVSLRLPETDATALEEK